MTRPTLPALKLIPCLLLLVLGPLGSRATEPVPTRPDRAFNLDWRFHLGDAPGAEAAAFADLEWQRVDLPHDWSIALERDPRTPEGRDTGYYRGGVGWYRKTFAVPAAEAGREVEVIFDGVQQDCDVWINGHFLGFQPHGYIGFSHRLTPYLRAGGERNVLAVRAVNPEVNSRWYSGSGIYRNVELRFSSPVDVATWGLLLDTIALTPQEAVVQLRAELHNRTAAPRDVRLQLRVDGPGGTRSSFDLGVAHLAPSGSETISHTFRIQKPDPWSPDHPALYACELELHEGETVLGRQGTTFGIREIAVSAAGGFRLNGQELKLQGACLHHDNGLLGAAAFDQAEWRRVAIMKRNGFNAIRTSHNPPSRAFLAACDRLGMLVVDEFVDMWEVPKRMNDYHRYFVSHWQQDLRRMLRRDYNSPSVVLWSIGNEIPERASPAGVAIARQMTAAIRELDRLRPITAAICHGWEHPEWPDPWEPNAAAFAPLDIGGYNYRWRDYAPDHARYPNRVMLGTESFPLEAFASWTAVENNPWVLGDFVWTGMDHLGESGIGFSHNVDRSLDTPPRADWPVWINNSGDIDLTGVKKPASYFRDVLWRRSAIEILVHRPIPDGQHEVLSQWGWPDELASWNWTGCEGKTLSVRVVSRAPRVRLELNGRLVGESAIDAAQGITATFEVPFAPGELKATALDANGNAVNTRVLATSGAAAAVALLTETEGVRALRSDLLFVPIEIRDAQGALVTDAAPTLSAAVTGPAEIAAFGTGDPGATGRVHDQKTQAFRGRALLILRATGQNGSVRIEVTSPHLTAGTATVELK